MTWHRLFEDLLILAAIGAFVIFVWAADALAFHP